jgi:guanylate kinase
MAIDDIAGKTMIAFLDIEIDGVQQIQGRSSIDARYVFIKPPNLEALGARLRSRGTESEDDLLSRIARASDEIDFAETGRVYGKIIVNDDLERAYGELEDFVFQSPL